MKKTLTVILGFILVMAACLGLAALVDRFRPEKEPVTVTADESVLVANVMDAATATTISLRGDTAEITGLGAAVEDGGIKIVYPGTYRISGTLADGQILVDCDEFHGGVYLMLDGVDVTCSSGPAIYVKQSEKTVLHLMEGSDNCFRDGEGYTIAESIETSTGGAVYCDDDLYIEGAGTLTVIGSNADGIRSKDGLTIAGGTVTVYAADDGVQGSDYVDIQAGALTVGAYGDGIASKKGEVTLSDGVVSIVSGGDGISAAADVYLMGGSLTVTAYGGAENYETMAVNELSAKGVKGQNVMVSGGVYEMNTADDAIHGDLDLTIAGGEFFIRSGDDAISASRDLTVAGGTVTIETSYEGLEAATVTVTDGTVSIYAENDGVDAIGGFSMFGGIMTIQAPQCVSTDALFTARGGMLLLAATGEDTPLKFAQSDVTGGTVILTGNGTVADFQSGGDLPESLLFVLPGQLAAGSQVSLTDAAGTAILSFQTVQPCTMIHMVTGAMGLGQPYGLNADSWFMSSVLTEDCTVVR